MKISRIFVQGDNLFREVYSYGPQFKEQVMSEQGVKLNFFSNSHLAPKFFKVVANSKKVGLHFFTFLFFFFDYYNNKLYFFQIVLFYEEEKKFELTLIRPVTWTWFGLKLDP